MLKWTAFVEEMCNIDGKDVHVCVIVLKLSAEVVSKFQL